MGAWSPAIITSMLLLLRFLDDPVHPGVGGLEPVAMERTSGIIDEELAALGADVDRCHAKRTGCPG